MPHNPSPDPTRPLTPRGLTRRRLLTDGAALALATPSIAAGLYTTTIAPSSVALRVRRWRIEVENLPPSLSGLRIAHLSDLHQGAMMPSSSIAHAVEMALRERPDLVVLTGDYADRDGGDPHAAASLLAPLADTARCPLGAVGVLGNHDWYVGGPAMRDALTSVGVRVIDHTRLLLTAERTIVEPSRAEIEQGSDLRDNPHSLVIAGAGDFWEDHADPRESLVAAPDHVPRLLLMHNPDAIFRREFREKLGDRHPDLILAGHTHGGQVRIPLGIGNPRMPPHYSSDAFSREFADTRCGRMIVSHGVGCTIMPVRFGVPPEIGIIELVRAPAV